MNELDFVKKCRDNVVYFAEHMLFDETGDKYHLEPHQKAMMMSSEGNVVYFCGRRMGKSLMLAIEAIHRALFFKYQKIFIYMEADYGKNCKFYSKPSESPSRCLCIPQRHCWAGSADNI